MEIFEFSHLASSAVMLVAQENEFLLIRPQKCLGRVVDLLLYIHDITAFCKPHLLTLINSVK